uniref:TDP-4-keto-6-deoxy-D-glucose transaminase subfamily n=1 Tax=uncultured organism TaxID=155900 RepID=E3T2Z1_9ZZZZ|nr:TDP-4-keto-6-deoxy-D-glucose transaminase subfamily [uncultured organism]
MMEHKIPFNKPHLTGKEAHYLYQAVYSGHISGNGLYTQKCQKYFEDRWGFKKTLLTTSCTDALEMCALLLNIKPEDELIIPSYTFVSSALAFVRQGANIIFADSNDKNPNLDAHAIEEKITPKTKAIVVVHYAGIACDMDEIMRIARKHKLFVVEDAAQGIDSYYKGKPLGTIGDLSTFSFHETKNLQCGEGGLLGINNEQFIERAEILWEKGTNRAQFFKGQVDKYNWVDIGSSFLPSDVIAAFLYAQLEHIDDIQDKRKAIWNKYHEGLKPLEAKGNITLPFLPDFATNNAHMFYLITKNPAERTALISYLKDHNIMSVFHYLSLHASPFYKEKYKGAELDNANYYTNCLVRLPLFYELGLTDVDRIIDLLINFYKD